MDCNGQNHLHEASMMLRLALYSTLGWLLFALGQTWNTWGFWCVLGLFWAAEHVTRMETLSMVQAELAALKKRLQGQLNNEQEHKP